MARIIGKLSALVVEFLSRFWPISKTEETAIEEQRSMFGSDGPASTRSEDDCS